jgi:hypothetical protein
MLAAAGLAVNGAGSPNVPDISSVTIARAARRRLVSEKIRVNDVRHDDSRVKRRTARRHRMSR